MGTNDTANRTGLIEGNFSLTVTDGNGCTSEASVLVVENMIPLLAPVALNLSYKIWMRKKT